MGRASSQRQLEEHLPRVKWVTPRWCTDHLCQLQAIASCYHSYFISNLINWQPANDTSEGGVSLSGDSVVISSDSIHFNAASRSLGSPAYQSFSVQIKAPITTFSDTIVAYAIYDTIPVIWQMAASHNHIITETMVANYPLHFLVFTVIDGDFYAGFLAATPVSGNNYIVNLSKTSPAALRSQIDAL